MKIDRYTLYKDFAPIEPYVDASKLDELMRSAVAVVQYHAGSVGNLIKCSEIIGCFAEGMEY